MSEYRGFVFAIVFIVIFAGLLASIPIDLQGQGDNPDIPTPLDAALVTGFTDYEDWNMSDLSALHQYVYTAFNGRDWVFQYYTGVKEIALGAKITYFFLWFGNLESCEFINADGINRGSSLTVAEINLDADEGAVRYDIHFIGSGADAGGFVVYWNSTLYNDIEDAYDADKVSFLHGVGIVSTAGADVVSLLIGLLFLQLPDCPLLINLLLATPLYACVVFLIWFIIKETLPFV